VVTVSGEPVGFVPGADVRAQGTDGTIRRIGRTNNCGVVVFEPLPDGVYSVRAEANGSDGVAKDVQVARGKDSLVEVRLAGHKSEDGAPKQRSCDPPRYHGGSDPIYTSTALMRNVQGCLVVRCVITLEGSVRDCRALEPLEDLTASSIDALKRRRYTPMICDGKPVDTEYTYRINFRLPRGWSPLRP
jgi:outer membrane biosynthesis protein TonB